MADITIRISDRTLKITGIFLGGICLVWVFSHLWSAGVFIPKYQLRVYVPDVSGLGSHAKVSLNGAEIGSVSTIKLAGDPTSPERRFELVLRVDKHYQAAIRSDSTATLASEGLLGSRHVSIQRGFKGSVINPYEEIPFVPTQEISFKDVLKSVQKTVDCLQAEKNSPASKTQAPPETPSKPSH